MSIFNVGDYIKSPKRNAVFYVKEKLDGDRYTLILIDAKASITGLELPPWVEGVGYDLTADEKTISNYRKVKLISIEE